MTGMTEMMNFPERWEDFLHDYEFEDDRRIYTNGSKLIPSFRVKQMMEHYAPVRHGQWKTELDDLGWLTHTCTVCGYTKRTDIHVSLGWNYCPNCGAKMDGDTNE